MTSANRGVPAGRTLRLARRAGRVRGDGPADRRGRLRGARRGYADGRERRGAGTSGGLWVLREQADDDGRGRRSSRRRQTRSNNGSTRERNQGRAPDMGWLDHDRLGFNYRLSDIACALGLAQL